MFLFTLSKHQITHIYSFGSFSFLFWIVLVLGRVHSGGKKVGMVLYTFFLFVLSVRSRLLGSL